jgi:hypothetical protein
MTEAPENQDCFANMRVKFAELFTSENG